MPPPDDQEPELTFADAFVPILTAGEYTLTATQTLYADVTRKAQFEEIKANKTFWVAAPRFSLAPDEIYARYPADGHSGPYHETVPHVVCRRRALPWERPLNENEQRKTPAEPWMALLLFHEGELTDTPFATASFQQLVQPADQKIRSPQISLTPWEKEAPPDNNRCTVLDISWELFQRVAPRRAELPYLAHARLVTVFDKEDLQGIDDGWFSVVLANRLPANGQRNVAVLISLEGHHALMADPEPAPAGKTTVRLVVLARWTFESKGDALAEAVKALYQKALYKDGIKTGYEDRDMWLRVSDGKKAGKDIEPASVATALKLGYVPLRHELRHGDRTVSWYRGPIVPATTPARTRNFIFVNADAALQFDEKTGLFDISYAAAWQLGRLLALQSPEFARALFHLESGLVAETSMTEAAKIILPDATEEERAALAPRAARLSHDDLMSAIAFECLGG
jgi:hypothetical protein